MSNRLICFCCCSVFFTFLSCGGSTNTSIAEAQQRAAALHEQAEPESNGIGLRIAKAAMSIVNPEIIYVPEYVVIPYPGGDVPPGTGVCTDVVIRSLRKIGIDLQQEVHEDMKANFAVYPRIWGLSRPDKNIDHRRVPNLMKYFERRGFSLPLSTAAKDYQPGDIVAWQLDNGMTHIGIVSHQKNRKGERYTIVHNIGHGQVEEDVLFAYRLIGHYRLQEA